MTDDTTAYETKTEGLDTEPTPKESKANRHAHHCLNECGGDGWQHKDFGGQEVFKLLREAWLAGYADSK